MNNVKDLITPITAEEMVRVYNQVKAELEIAYQSIDDCAKRLEATFGDKERYRNFICIPDRYFKLSEFDKSIMAPIRETVWKNLIYKLGIGQLITVERMKVINRNIEDDQMGPVTVDNLFEVLDLIVGSSGELALELFKEAYDILRPARFGDRGNWKQYKTNNKNGRFDIGKKIILTNVFSWFNSDKEQEIVVIDKVFHLLDGKPFPSSYRSPLLDAINLSKQNTNHPVGENEYFKWKGYSNGNLHLEFKRMDLVSALNVRCADKSTLKGE